MHTEKVEQIYRRHIKELREAFLKYSVPLLQGEELVLASRNRGGKDATAPRPSESSTSACSRRVISPRGWFDLLEKLEMLCATGESAREQQTMMWQRCWTWKMAAMTHVDEVNDTEGSLHQLRFVEFLEVLARLAVLNLA